MNLREQLINSVINVSSTGLKVHLLKVYCFSMLAVDQASCFYCNEFLETGLI